MEKKRVEVKIREYRRSDDSAVKRIFDDGMMNQIVPAGFKVLTSRIALPISIFVCIVTYSIGKPEFVSSTLSANIGSIHLDSRVLNSFLATALCFVGLAVFCYLNMRHVMVQYVQKSLKSDLSDIVSHYVNNKDTVFFVATINDKVVGCVALDRVEGRSHLTEAEKAMICEDSKNRAKGKWGELRRMSVDASIRRFGIATKLHNALMNFAREQNLRGVFLTTSSLQGPAIVFYEKLGYKLKASRDVPSKIMKGMIKLLTYDIEVTGLVDSKKTK